MKKTKVLICTLVMTLISTPFLSTYASAQTSLKDSESTETFTDLNVEIPESDVVFEGYGEGYYELEYAEVDGVTYEIETIGKENETIINVTDDNGTITYINEIGTDNFTVKSDFLDSDEISEIEEDMVGAIEISPGEEEEPTISLFAQTGSWKHTKPYNITITANGKFTAQTIIGLIGSALGFKGAAAAAFANIMIQYNLKTGYFTKSNGTRLDTNRSYIWQRVTTKLYKESSRKTLLKTTNSTPKKVYIGSV